MLKYKNKRHIYVYLILTKVVLFAAYQALSYLRSATVNALNMVEHGHTWTLNTWPFHCAIGVG